MVSSRDGVPPIGTMWSPIAPYRGFLVDDEFGSQWYNGPRIEIAGPIEHDFRSHLWVKSGWVKEIQGHVCLLKQLIPKLEWETWIKPTEYGKKNIFPCLVVSFGSVCSTKMG